jgi:predicted PurR-regulated permease PerM
VLLGHWAGKHRMLNKAWNVAKEVQLGILIAVVCAISCWVVVVLIRRRMRKPAATLTSLPGGRAPAEPTPLKRTTEA